MRRAEEVEGVEGVEVEDPESAWHESGGLKLGGIIKIETLNLLILLFPLLQLYLHSRESRECLVSRSQSGNRLKLNGAVAQLVEQWTENPCVAGSSPAHTTKALAKMPGFFVSVLKALLSWSNLSTNIIINYLFIYPVNCFRT